MIPRVGERIRLDRRYRPRPGAYAILPRRGEVLLTVQDGSPPDIQLPGGGIDAGEGVRPALYREVLEETGWRITTPRRIGAFRRFAYMPEYDLWAEKLCHIYLARPARQVGPPLEPDHSVLWLPWADAIDAVGNDGDRMFLQHCAARGYPL